MMLNSHQVSTFSGIVNQAEEIVKCLPESEGKKIIEKLYNMQLHPSQLSLKYSIDCHDYKKYNTVIDKINSIIFDKLEYKLSGCQVRFFFELETRLDRLCNFLSIVGENSKGRHEGMLSGVEILLSSNEIEILKKSTSCISGNINIVEYVMNNAMAYRARRCINKGTWNGYTEAIETKNLIAWMISNGKPAIIVDPRIGLEMREYINNLVISTLEKR